MKSRFLLPTLLLALAVFCGCARSYVITLTHGGRVVCAGKPKLKDGYYTYKDVRGEKYTVSELRVREIAPASMSQSEFSTGERRDFLPK